MTSEGLGEMFEGDTADMCAGKFSLMLMGSERRVLPAQTCERKLIYLYLNKFCFQIDPFKLVFWL